MLGLDRKPGENRPLLTTSHQFLQGWRLFFWPASRLAPTQCSIAPLRRASGMEQVVNSGNSARVFGLSLAAIYYDAYSDRDELGGSATLRPCAGANYST